MKISKEILDELLKDCKTAPDLFGEGRILKQPTTALVERTLEAELSSHLVDEKHEGKANSSSNSRNGYSSKTIQGEFGCVEISVPRDRIRDFEPQKRAKPLSDYQGWMTKLFFSMPME